MASSKASRSDSRCAVGSMIASTQWRLVSWQLSEKCLIVEMTPRSGSQRSTPPPSSRAEQRVLGQVLEVAPVARIAGQVDPAGQQHVEPAHARLASDHRPGDAGQIGIEARPERQACGQRGRGIAGTKAGVGHPQAGVAHDQRRDAQPGHARRVARAHRRAFRDPRLARPDPRRDCPSAPRSNPKRSSSVICASVARARASGSVTGLQYCARESAETGVSLAGVGAPRLRWIGSGEWPASRIANFVDVL